MKKPKEIPREEGIDRTLSLKREGYMFIPNRRRSFHSDFFKTRLFGKDVVCMGGKEAAELFYDNEKFKRNGATPKWIVQSFFGKNSVQTLDGDSHRHRKNMLMSIMTENNLKQLVDIAKQQWKKAIDQWEQMDQVILYEEMQKLLCRTACQWVGIELKEDEVDRRTKELASLFESASSVGPAYLVGRSSRNNLDEWIGELIDGVRNGKVDVHDDEILYQFAFHRDLEGNLLDAKTAAVEVINLLRPIVAISIFNNFLALAVHHYSEKTEKLRTGDQQYAQMFVQEVRRFYPFFPFIPALVKKDFTWGDYQFKEGTMAILDIYGTNQDSDIWENPDVFNPDRFKEWEGRPFGFIPQGGGDYWAGHRCAGEWATIEIMKVSLEYLANRMNYDVPDQDLSFSMVSMPSIPQSKILIENVNCISIRKVN